MRGTGTVSTSWNGVAVVTKGLAAGDRVVTSGSYRLQNGTPVTTNEIAETESTQGQAP